MGAKVTKAKSNVLFIAAACVGLAMSCSEDDPGNNNSGGNNSGTNTNSANNNTSNPTSACDSCDANADCVVVSAMDTCVCGTGYEGDGETCTDIDGCAPSPCFVSETASSTCTDVPAPGTGFECGPCPVGLVGDGIGCSPPPQCTANTDCNDNNDCTSDSCVASECVFVVLPEGATCGDGTASECNRPDTCDGFGVCRSNLVAEGTICRPAGDNRCDVDEQCDAFGNCPNNQWAAAGSECGSPTDTTCDRPDSCDGAGTCLPNYASTVTVCRSANGNDCDIAETCDGAGNCPGDRVEDEGTPCGNPSTSTCDRADQCDGNGNCDPNFAPTTTVCRPAIDPDCDIEERCDGAGACPQDAFRPPNTLCGDSSSSACDGADTCDGSGNCDDNFAPATTVCRAGNGICNPEELCDGLGNCPPDVVADAGTACGDDTSDECTEPDTCNDSGVCQANNIAPTELLLSVQLGRVAPDPDRPDEPFPQVVPPFTVSGNTIENLDCNGEVPLCTPQGEGFNGAGSGEARFRWTPSAPTPVGIKVRMPTSTTIFDAAIYIVYPGEINPDDGPCRDDLLNDTADEPYAWFTPNCTALAGGTYDCDQVEIIVDGSNKGVDGPFGPAPQEGIFELEFWEHRPTCNECGRNECITAAGC